MIIMIIVLNLPWFNHDNNDIIAKPTLTYHDLTMIIIIIVLNLPWINHDNNDNVKPTMI
jgi:hypothetical protein